MGDGERPIVYEVNEVSWQLCAPRDLSPAKKRERQEERTERELRLIWISPGGGRGFKGLCAMEERP